MVCCFIIERLTNSGVYSVEIYDLIQNCTVRQCLYSLVYDHQLFFEIIKKICVWKIILLFTFQKYPILPLFLWHILVKNGLEWTIFRPRIFFLNHSIKFPWKFFLSSMELRKNYNVCSWSVELFVKFQFNPLETPEQ